MAAAKLFAALLVATIMVHGTQATSPEPTETMDSTATIDSEPSEPITMEGGTPMTMPSTTTKAPQTLTAGPVSPGTYRPEDIALARTQNRSEYLLISLALSFDDAKEYCEGLPNGAAASLASIHTPDENNFVRKLAKNGNIAGSYVWLGVQRVVGEPAAVQDQFAFVDGTVFDILGYYTSFGFDNCFKATVRNGKKRCLFMRYQPSERDIGVQDCVAMRMRGEWNDLACTRQLPFVCKRPAL